MNDDKRGPEQAPGKDRGDFRRGLLYAAVPIWALGLVSTAAIVVEGFLWLWALGAGYALVAFLVGLGYAASRESQTGLGILAGVGLGVLGLGVTCYANVTGSSGFV